MSWASDSMAIEVMAETFRDTVRLFREWAEAQPFGPIDAQSLIAFADSLTIEDTWAHPTATEEKP